jgi:hypothetical protein
MSAVLGCTVILTPRDDVERCGTADDCAPTGDERYVSECRFDPANVDQIDSTEVDKICVATFRTINCDPMGYGGAGGAHPFPMFDMDVGSGLPTRYNCDETPGVRGCPPGEDGCGEGLVQRDDGVCDASADPDVPAIRPSPDVAGQDVRDQFCRSFFCEDDFVCDTSGSSATCVRCDPDLPFGEGGCGEVYIAGAPSCVYVGGSALESGCAGSDATVEEPLFGDCPGA